LFGDAVGEKTDVRKSLLGMTADQVKSYHDAKDSRTKLLQMLQLCHAAGKQALHTGREGSCWFVGLLVCWFVGLLVCTCSTLTHVCHFCCCWDSYRN
jgi:hypothetical protein